MAYIYLLSFPHRWRYRPFHFSLPLHSLTYITHQQTNMAAIRLATRSGDARSATLFLGSGPPKHTYGGPFHTPRPKIHTAGGPPFPIPTCGDLPITSQPRGIYWPSGAQNPNGPISEVQICTPPFWAHGQLTPKGPNVGGCNFESPFWAHLGSLAHFQFYAPHGQWPTPTPTDTQPMARKPTHLGVDLNWTRSLASPSPTLGATLGSTLKRPNLWLANPPTAQELHIPHTGGQHGRSLTSNVTPTPMKLKNKFSFGPSQGGSLLL